MIEAVQQSAGEAVGRYSLRGWLGAGDQRQITRGAGGNFHISFDGRQRLDYSELTGVSDADFAIGHRRGALHF